MTSTGSDDPARQLADYYPVWLDNLADDVTLEGSMMDGFVQGPEAVRTVLVHIRSLYDYQEFHAVGPFGDNGWFEDYTAGVRGEPIKNITVVTRDAAGQTQPRRGQLPAPEHPAALVPADRREVRRHPHWRALPRQRVLNRTYPPAQSAAVRHGHSRKGSS